MEYCYKYGKLELVQKHIYKMFLKREDYMFFKCLFVKVERGSKDLKPKTNEVSSEVTGLKRCDKEKH